ncbi:Uncharacterised protein [Budvicia aquatica]|uniref:Uncharacterized protein n=1 Tax=Budvicia aquatica TaxID=82979 RepID=A0A484ZV63_9GAMM|nr:Uncharacterised protein [Budvicia aquatica]
MAKRLTTALSKHNYDGEKQVQTTITETIN